MTAKSADIAITHDFSVQPISSATAPEMREAEIPAAYFVAALQYFYGDGVEQNEQKAVELLRQSNMLAHYPAELFLQAIQGNRVHQCKLGDFYRYGTQQEGLERDYDKALYWYYRAARQASPTAARALFQLYHDGLVELKEGDDSAYLFWCRVGALLGEPVCKSWVVKLTDSPDSMVGGDAEAHREIMARADQWVAQLQKPRVPS